MLSLKLQIATLENEKGQLQSRITFKQEEGDEEGVVELEKEKAKAESALGSLQKELDTASTAATKEDGPIMKELRCLERCLLLQITAYFGGSLNGPDSNKVFDMKPFPVQYKLNTCICPVCGEDFSHALAGSHARTNSDSAAKAMLQHLLKAHEGTTAHTKATAECAQVPCESPLIHLPFCFSSLVVAHNFTCDFSSIHLLFCFS